MATSKTCLAQLSRSALSPALRTSASLPPAFLVPYQQQRAATQSLNALKYKRKDQPTANKKRKSKTTFTNHDLKDAIQFPLLDAMRYVCHFPPPASSAPCPARPCRQNCSEE